MCYKIHLNPPRNHRKPWTPAMMLALAKLFKKGAPYNDMCERMGRTKSALYTRVCILRIVVVMSPHAKQLKGVATHRKGGKQK